MTAELSVTHHQSSSRSPDGSGIVGGIVNSPRSSAGRQSLLPAPWAQVVRGEPESVSVATPSAAPEQAAPVIDSAPALTGYSSGQSPGQTLAAAAAAAAAVDETAPVVVGSSDGGNAGGGSKKAVWNKPLNGAAAASADTTTSPVMGAESWPALSELTRPLPKSSPESSSKPIPDVSIPSPQGPVISHTPHKPAKPSSNANSNHNHGHPVRQRLMKRGSSGPGTGGSTGFTRPPGPPPASTPPSLPPPFPMFEMPYPNLVPPVLDAPVRGVGPYKGNNNNNWVPRPMGDHSSHRNPSRRGNFGGGRPRGDGPSANGYGGRHDQDRDWHGPRGSDARDVHMHHQMVPPPPHAPRGFPRPAHPGAPPFIAPPLRPFGNPMGFDMQPYLYLLPPETFRGAPLLPPHSAPMFFPPLPTMILTQFDYYFSESNLVKDNYLRSNMDDEAWVPVSLIANFPRVQSLTNDIQLILDSLRNSTVVEVQGDKVRPRKDWKKWVTPGGSSGSSLPTSFQKLAIEEVTTKLKSTFDSSDADSENVPGLSPGQESTDEQSKLTNGEVIAEACSSNI